MVRSLAYRTFQLRLKAALSFAKASVTEALLQADGWYEPELQQIGTERDSKACAIL